MSNDTDLFNQVLFESDRTCCVCRFPDRPVQIHHIDGNHDNNERSNLAVVCDICHKEAHTKVPFSQNLNPELVRLYDKSWRSICATRLLPGSDARELDEYRQEILLEIAIVCHHWKNGYMALYPGNFKGISGNFKDVWDMLIATGDHEDSGRKIRNTPLCLIRKLTQ